MKAFLQNLILTLFLFVSIFTQPFFALMLSNF